MTACSVAVMSDRKRRRRRSAKPSETAKKVSECVWRGEGRGGSSLAALVRLGGHVDSTLMFSF